jgi:hypothetical protein
VDARWPAGLWAAGGPLDLKTKMHWLNLNAGAIQALSSMAYVLLTAVLALITWRYVKLTHELLRGQLKAAAARRRELRAQIAVLKAFLDPLPSPDDQRLSGRILDHSNDLRDFSFNRFRELASEVSAETGSQAAELEGHVTWLVNLIREIRAVPPLTGYRWSDFPKKDYDTHVRFAIGALSQVVEQLNQFERKLSESESG